MISIWVTVVDGRFIASELSQRLVYCNLNGVWTVNQTRGMLEKARGQPVTNCPCDGTDCGSMFLNTVSDVSSLW